MKRGLTPALLAWVLLAACGRGAPAAPGPAAPSPPVAPAPPADPVHPLAVPPLLAQVLAARWRFADLAGALPGEEAAYQSSDGAPDFIEHAYDGGHLRLYTDAGGREVFALLVDAGSGPYAAFQPLTSAAGYSVSVAAQYVVVCRADPLDPDSFLSLRALRFPTAADLTARLGPPSYRYRLPGAEYAAYLPQGLLFAGGRGYQLRQGAPPGASLALDQSYAAYRSLLSVRQAGFAQQQAWTQAQVADALAKGKSSPDGRARAGLWAAGAGGPQQIIVQRPGRAEWRQPAVGLVAGWEWLDDRQVIYGLEPSAGQDTTFYTIDTATGHQTAAARVPGGVQAFGVVAPGRIWYTGGDGQRRELVIP